jgi:hypothetical protein
MLRLRSSPGEIDVTDAMAKIGGRMIAYLDRHLGRVVGLGLLFLFISLGASSAQAQTDAKIVSVNGQVTVNGRPAAVGDTFSSGAVIETTGQNSSAVVSLGKLGRVEVTEDTKMTLSFDNHSITILLSRGTVKVSARPGVEVTITRGS